MDVTGVIFTANGQPAQAWRRDDVDLYQFHLTIPPGVLNLARPSRLHRHGRCHRSLQSWSGRLLLYPADVPVREIPIQPRSSFHRMGYRDGVEHR